MNRRMVKKREANYGKAVDKLYSIMMGVMNRAPLFQRQHRGIPSFGQESLVKIMLKRIEKGKLILEPHDGRFAIRFSGAFNYYNFTSMPDHRRIAHGEASLGREAWAETYRMARIVARIFCGAKLSIFKSPDYSRGITRTKFGCGFVFSLPLPI